MQQDEFKPRQIDTFTGRMPVEEGSIVSALPLGGAPGAGRHFRRESVSCGKRLRERPPFCRWRAAPPPALLAWWAGSCVRGAS